MIHLLQNKSLPELPRGFYWSYKVNFTPPKGDAESVTLLIKKGFPPFSKKIASLDILLNETPSSKGTSFVERVKNASEILLLEAHFSR